MNEHPYRADPPAEDLESPRSRVRRLLGTALAVLSTGPVERICWFLLVLLTPVPWLLARHFGFPDGPLMALGIIEITIGIFGVPIVIDSMHPNVKAVRWYTLLPLHAIPLFVLAIGVITACIPIAILYGLYRLPRWFVYGT